MTFMEAARTGDAIGWLDSNIGRWWRVPYALGFALMVVGAVFGGSWPLRAICVSGLIVPGPRRRAGHGT